MNFRTESLDFPQNEQRRCLSCDMAVRDAGEPGTSYGGAGRASGRKRGHSIPLLLAGMQSTTSRDGRPLPSRAPVVRRSGGEARLLRFLNQLAPTRDDVVDHSVIFRFLGRQEAVAVEVALDLL